jgi:hypothetical protein
MYLICTLAIIGIQLGVFLTLTDDVPEPCELLRDRRVWQRVNCSVLSNNSSAFRCVDGDESLLLDPFLQVSCLNQTSFVVSLSQLLGQISSLSLELGNVSAGALTAVTFNPRSRQFLLNTSSVADCLGGMSVFEDIVDWFEQEECERQLNLVDTSVIVFGVAAGCCAVTVIGLVWAELCWDNVAEKVRIRSAARRQRLLERQMCDVADNNANLSMTPM